MRSHWEVLSEGEWMCEGAGLEAGTPVGWILRVGPAFGEGVVAMWKKYGACKSNLAVIYLDKQSWRFSSLVG